METYSYKLGGRSRTDWLVDQYWGLWPLLEWIGALASALFLVKKKFNQFQDLERFTHINFRNIKYY